jgi:rhodanese-related sulfurtransferase
MAVSGFWQTVLLVVAFLVSSSNAQIIQLTSQQLYDLLTGGKIDLLIDVRTESEWNLGHIENATFVKNLQAELADTDDYQATLTSLNLWGCRYCNVAVYCGSGARAGEALDHLIKAGFEGQLYNGLGVSQWTSMGYELVNDPSKDDRPCMSVDNPELLYRNQEGACSAKATQSIVALGELTTPESAVSEAYYDGIQMELDSNKDLFLAQMGVRNATTYSFRFELSCFCPPADYPWLVTAELQQMMMGVKPNTTQEMSSLVLMNPVQSIMGDVVLSAITTGGRDVASMEGSSLKSYSILDLFDKIQDALDRQAFDIRVVYNAEWGYPEEIAIDYDPQMADEEFYTTASDFTIVEAAWEDEDYGLMDTNTTRIEYDAGL